MTVATSTSHLDPEVFVTFLGRTRWFGGKGRPFVVSALTRAGVVPGRVEGGPTVVVHLVELAYADVAADAPDARELYQVPLVFYPEPETRLDHAFVGWWEEPGVGWVHAYDALHDREAMACWLRSFGTATPDLATGDQGGLVFHRVPGHDLDLETHSTLFTGEQSNSSVAYGEDSVLKLFRKVTVGINPDIELHEVLTRAGTPQVADLYGWVELTLDSDSDGDVWQLGVLQQFLRTATDGWDLALASVRNLFAEEDLHAHEVGGDFAGEAARLGEALREVHGVLSQLGTSTLPAAALRDRMVGRLHAALPAVPGLHEHEAALLAVYDRVAELDDLEVQRIHGDLHLGQTMRTSVGWKIVDFEGEPAKTLAERRLPDSRWRDVAGMLRSFDYAPHVVQRSQEEADVAENRYAYRAAEWAHRNRRSFLMAYSGGELSAVERTLLDAYVADKAVYEAVYETRNRPTWVAIPLEAIARIGAA